MFLKLILDTVSVSADYVLFNFPDGELFNRLRLASLLPAGSTVSSINPQDPFVCSNDTLPHSCTDMC